MTSKIVKCTCSHADQDKMYGQGNRMANETRSAQLRCTVCGTLHGSASLATAVKKASPAAEPAKKEPEKKVISKKESEKKSTSKSKPEKKETKAKDAKGSKDIKGKSDKKKSMKGSKR